ncbi:MAG: MBL fold metallo-hydrolase, partial [Nanoarchaeota archaeon]|nr:MBL fold metallo-hydrolase [Nanoarchaeota archaeon]
MKLTILGSGTFIPDKDRFCSSYLLQHENRNILFDFGRGAIQQLMKLNIDLFSINHIFITHPHSDHLSELPSFVSFIMNFSEKNNVNEKIKIYCPKSVVA